MAAAAEADAETGEVGPQPGSSKHVQQQHLPTGGAAIQAPLGHQPPHPPGPPQAVEGEGGASALGELHGAGFFFAEGFLQKIRAYLRFDSSAPALIE